jgi:hypothetical protein
MEKLHTLAESTNYLLCHSYEYAYVIDKRDGVKRDAGDHYGDPKVGLISPDETWFCTGGEGVQCFRLDGTLRSFFRERDGPSPETWFVRSMTQRSDDVVTVFFDVKEGGVRVWDIQLFTAQVTERLKLVPESNE